MIGAIIALIILGLLLMMLEFLVIPGVTIAGIGGLLLIGGGVYFTYDTYGITAGNYTTGGSAIFIIAIIFYSLRAKTWDKLMLKTNIDSKIESYDTSKVQVGDIGETITKLSPMGKVHINDLYIDGHSRSTLIEPNTKVEVVKVLPSKIIVKQIK